MASSSSIEACRKIAAFVKGIKLQPYSVTFEWFKLKLDSLKNGGSLYSLISGLPWDSSLSKGD